MVLLAASHGPAIRNCCHIFVKVSAYTHSEKIDLAKYQATVCCGKVMVHQ